MESMPQAPPPRWSIHEWITLALQGILGVGVVLSLYEAQWLNAAALAGILALTAMPSLIGRRVGLQIPPEFELAAIAFLFAALFLGETRGYYSRYWWWDIALHTTSGALLGLLGVLLVYVLNETPRVHLRMRSGFVAFFAFCFAMAVGALWEIFEFSMDRLFGMTMQKPMFTDPSGLTDTMWDLIVNAIGAAVVCVASYVYMRRGSRAVIEPWVQRFIEANPGLFRRRSAKRD